MNRFPPDIDPKIYILTAAIIGFALLDEFTANEQNAIGNWFMLVGQIMETNSAFQQISEERITGTTINTNSHEYKQGGSAFMKNKYKEKSPFDQNEDIARLEKMISIMQNEIEQIKRQL